MKRRFPRVMLLGLLVFLLSVMGIISLAGAQGPQDWALFGHDNVNHTIVQIDTATGQATLVGPTGFDSGMAALARSNTRVPGPGGTLVDAGSLFGLLRDNALGTDYIVVVDVTTGTAHKLVETERQIEGRGIAFGPNDNLYVVEGPSGRLSIVDTVTGAVNLVGDTGFSTSSLEWDSDTGFFYAVAAVKGVEIPNLLIKIDPTDASSEIVGSELVEPPNLDFQGCTIVRSPVTGVWYTVNINTKDLVTLDLTAGQIDSVVGNLGAASSAAVCGTVFAPSAQADLAITKTDDPDPVMAGETLTYTLEITNNGPSDTTGVTVTDALPAEVSFDSATPSQGSCSEAGGTLTCDLGDLAVGASATIQVVVTVDPTTPNGTTLTNTAEVTSDLPDPDLTNNSATAETQVVRPEADLAITKTDDPDPVIAGETLTYTLEITNNGPSDATGVNVIDTLPAEVSFDSASPSQGSCSEAGGTLTCDLGDLAVGASATIQVVVTVDPATADGTTLTNTAEVTSDIPDPDPTNNSASADTQVINQADLSVVKTDDPDPVVAGETLTYTLAVSNAGPNTAVDVQVVDTLPADVTFQDASGDGWTCSEASGTVTCTRPDLPIGDAPPITIVIGMPLFDTETDITNGVTVGSSTPDPNPDNNTDTEITHVLVPEPPPGTDKITARVFIDFACDTYFQGRLDIPLAGVPVTARFLANGARQTLLTTSFGWVYFAGFDSSGGVELSVELPADYMGFALGNCPSSPTTVVIGPGGFDGGVVRHANVDFRATVLGEMAGR